MPRAKQRTPELRDHLLEVAITTLSEEGIARFTTRRVAERAGTSVPAVYELSTTRPAWCGRCSSRDSDYSAPSSRKCRRRTIRWATWSGWCRCSGCSAGRTPKLAQVMFSRPFADFEPGAEELAAGASVREVFVGRIQRCIGAGLLSGDPTDIAHVLLALAQGLAVQEAGRWLGSGPSIERRWKLGVSSLLNGFHGS